VASLNPNDEIESKRRLVKEALQHLPPQCMEAFMLKVFDGLKYGEIAQRLGITSAVVESHIARGIYHVQAYVSRHSSDTKH